MFYSIISPCVGSWLSACPLTLSSSLSLISITHARRWTQIILLHVCRVAHKSKQSSSSSSSLHASTMAKRPQQQPEPELSTSTAAAAWEWKAMKNVGCHLHSTATLLPTPRIRVDRWNNADMNWRHTCPCTQMTTWYDVCASCIMNTMQQQDS